MRQRSNAPAVAASGAVTLWVADTGCGIDESHPAGTGLANLRERLRASCGTSAVLALHGVRPHGVRAEITLPAALP